MDGAVPYADLDALKTALKEREQRIEALPFEIAQRKRLLFGRRSEHLEKPVDPNRLPLYRLEQLFAAHGFRVARTTGCGGVMPCGQALLPLVERMMALLKQQAVLFSDDTPVALQDTGQIRETRFGVYTGHSPPLIVYPHTTSRAGKHPKAHLAGFTGYLQVDAYAG